MDNTKRHASNGMMRVVLSYRRFFRPLERCECTPVRILLRCGLDVGRQVGGRFVSDNSGNDTSRVAAVRCGIEELHLGCVSGVGQTTGNLRCTRSYVAYVRCSNSRGRVWGRIIASPFSRVSVDRDGFNHQRLAARFGV